jgi:hypothetical protein
MLKDVTPQGWLLASVVLIGMLTAAILIIMGAINGNADLRATGLSIMLPILSAFGVYQVVSKKA